MLKSNNEETKHFYDSLISDRTKSLRHSLGRPSRSDLVLLEVKKQSPNHCTIRIYLYIVVLEQFISFANSVILNCPSLYKS